MPPRGDVALTVATFAAALERLTQHAQAQATSGVQSFDGWYDPAAVTELATTIAANVQATQRQSAATTDAYLARATSQITGRGLKPAGVVKTADLRNGVRLDRVYGRLADQYRYLRSTGKTDVEALQLVEQRAVKMTATDTELASRAQAQKFMVVRHVDGYRRILHPELSQHGACGLCVAASDRIYHRHELMPIHADCKCTVLPIVNGKDPGHALNQADIGRLYTAAGNTAGDSLKRIRVETVHHGELGPVLVRHGQHWRSPADVAASAA